MNNNSYRSIKDKLTSLGESEMQMFRFLLGKPAGVLLTVETDKILARLLAQEELVDLKDDMVIVPESIRAAYLSLWSDETELTWQKQNWMYKCIEAGRYLYGVMTWDVLGQLFRLGYPDADEAEIRGYFNAVPADSQWFTDREGKLVLNGFEKNDYIVRATAAGETVRAFAIRSTELTAEAREIMASREES